MFQKVEELFLNLFLNSGFNFAILKAEGNIEYFTYKLQIQEMDIAETVSGKMPPGKKPPAKKPPGKLPLGKLPSGNMPPGKIASRKIGLRKIILLDFRCFQHYLTVAHFLTFYSD